MREIRLALDTASNRLSVAAQENRGAAACRSIEGARRHASSLLPLAEEVLSEVDAGPGDITEVALADGPGSFTGLRVGAAFAKALTASGRVRLVVSPSLLVRAAGRAKRGERVLAMSSAMRGEVFAGMWAFESNAVTEIVAPRAFAAEALVALPRADVVVGEGPDPVRQLMTKTWGTPVEQVWPDAATLLWLSAISGGTRVVDTPDRWEPDYGRPAEAQARWEREHGRALPDSPGYAR